MGLVIAVDPGPQFGEHVILAKNQPEYHALESRLLRDDPAYGCPVYTTEWQPTPAELATLMTGGHIRLRFLGMPFHPMTQEVVPGRAEVPTPAMPLGDKS